MGSSPKFLQESRQGLKITDIKKNLPQIKTPTKKS